MNTKTPFSVIQRNKHDHLDPEPKSHPRLRLVVKGILGVLGMMACIGLWLLGGLIHIWIDAHLGQTLTIIGFVVGFIIIYNLVKIVPPEQLSQKKWPSTNRSW